MRVLVVGGGGREHALVWKINQSPKIEKIYCSPGNAGVERMAECISIDPDNIQELLDFAVKKEIDLTVVGPEAPLVDGIVDVFEENGLDIFGPNKAAARIEGSKVFAKEFMRRNNIPTADFKCFSNLSDAEEYIINNCESCVIKADGLAGGKGVIVVDNKDDALKAVGKIMGEKAFGDAGNKVVIENKLTGEEVSVLAFTDGNTIVPMASSQDHKPVYDGDRGPNTGGMGAYSPAPIYTKEIHEKVFNDILSPTVHGLRKEGVKFKGVLYAGLMITETGPQVLEFNVRFGDPEAQPILFRLKSNIVDIIRAVVNESLVEVHLEWHDEPSVCVVIASGGYPGKYEKGKPVYGINKEEDEYVIIFHSGTKRENDTVITSGGRVLGVTAKDNSLANAIKKAYERIEKVSFEHMHYRKDIGQKGLRAERCNK